MVEHKENTDNILLLYGLAKKSYFDMNDDERAVATKLASDRAREAAFVRGLPIIYGENGLVIAEYANGQRFVYENGKNVKPYHGA